MAKNSPPSKTTSPHGSVRQFPTLSPEERRDALELVEDMYQKDQLQLTRDGAPPLPKQPEPKKAQ